MGVVNNFKNRGKEQAKNKAKKSIKTIILTALKPILIVLFEGLILFCVAAAIIDWIVEIFTAENTPQEIYDYLEIENVSELVEIKGDETNGYYLDFVDGIDEKLKELVLNINLKAGYHKLPENNTDFLKKMIKAEIYTQFPNLGGTVPANSEDGFQGAVDIRRVTPNKNIGEMKNTGKGETSNIEEETTDDPVEISDRNDENRVKSWNAGDQLYVLVKAPMYEELRETGYWQEKLDEEEHTIYVEKDEFVTYTGTYEISENAVTKDTTVYVEVKKNDGTTGFVKLISLYSVDKSKSSSLTTESDELEMSNRKVATTSRARDVSKTIGKEGEQYRVAIAAGHNNTNNTGATSGNLVEEELTIKVAEKVEELLEEYSNIEVIQTGSTSENPGGIQVGERTELAREADPDLCIQIHFNAGGGTGVEAIYKDGDGISQQLAEILSETISTSMGLENRQAGSDIEKCAVGSLSIIENTALTGFPSVVTEGGFLDGTPDASVIESDGAEKYAEGIVKGIDKYFNSDHSGYTSTETTDQTFTTSVESKIINMKYVSPDTFQNYIDNGEYDKAIKSFTLDDERNLVTATWSMNADGNIELKANNAMDLKTALEKYKIPYEYLLYFYIDSDYADFSEELAEKVMESEIVVAVQDQITTVKTTDTTQQRKVASEEQFTESNWRDVSTETAITETVSTNVSLTYVNTWCVKTYQENSYSEAVIELGDSEEKIVEVPGKVAETSATSLSAETVVESGEAPTGRKDDEGNDIMYDYDIYQRIKTDTHTISNQYEKGDYKTEGKENVFVELYNKHNMESKIRTSGYLFSIIENNNKTVNLLNLTKYLIYKATNVPYGVLEFDYSIYDLSQFEDMGSSMGGLSTFKEYLHSWEGNTGVSADGTKYIVGDDGAGHPTVGYGIDIYNSGYLDRFLAAGYDVSIGSYIDVEFVDALEDEEIQSAIETVESRCAGLDLTIYQKYALVSRIYNCGASGAFTSRNGKTFVEAYNSYWNPDTDDEYKVTKNDGMYNHPLYTNYMSKPVTSGGSYMLGLERRRKSEWILFKTGYYDTIDKWCSESGAGGIVEKAIECHKFLREKGFHYAQAGVNIPITGNGRTIDCSSYVSWVLYEAGFKDLEGYQQTSYTFLANRWGWQEVSVSQAQPGDILIYSGHVEIMAADAGDRFRVYNCGGNSSINASGTAEYPESSISGRSKSQILKILRPSL